MIPQLFRSNTEVVNGQPADNDIGDTASTEPGSIWALELTNGKGGHAHLGVGTNK